MVLVTLPERSHDAGTGIEVLLAFSDRTVTLPPTGVTVIDEVAKVPSGRAPVATSNPLVTEEP
jgi:hypothetical protein